MKTASKSVQDRNKWPVSPCVLICTLDDENRCLGCGRSLEQISGWARMSKAEQWSVVDSLADWNSETDAAATGS
jgi:predicted Fe-S protein YdhL (DUF1289 family)